MNALAYLAMYGWIPVVLYLFTRFPARRAVIISFITAWLFLPQAKIPFSGIPDLTKMSVTCYGVLLAALLFDGQRLKQFRPGWIDIPMLIWCLCPIASSLTNGLGLYDGLSSALSQTGTWGFPYFIGRLYLSNLEGLRQFAIGTFLGGLAYMPLCLWEIRMSPQLHTQIYGWFPHSFAQTYRLGGWRPQVFMQHGLMVGIWMMTATLVGIWLWRAGVLKPIWGIPAGWLVAGLGLTFLLVKSTGAYLLLALGLIILFTARWLQSAIPLLLLLAFIPFYLQLTTTGNFTPKQQAEIVSFVETNISPDRAGSLETRFDNDYKLAEKARTKILFGWGGWGRNRVYAYNWRGELVDTSITDTLWIITFGQHGLVGLISLFSALLLPVLVFTLFCYPARTWFHPKVAPAAVLAVTLVLYVLDCLLNAMVNPIFALTAGGLSGLVIRETQPKQTLVRGKTIARKRMKATEQN
jgi:hypothetical protein